MPWQKLFFPGQWKKPVKNVVKISKNSGVRISFLPRCMEWSSDEKALHPFVKRVHCGKMEEKSVQIFIKYERSFSLVFREEEWLVGGDHF